MCYCGLCFILLIQTSEIANSVDDTFVASAQSPQQRELLGDHQADRPLYVEGGYRTWLRECCLLYFVLRSEETARSEQYRATKEREREEEEDYHSKIGRGGRTTGVRLGGGRRGPVLVQGKGYD